VPGALAARAVARVAAVLACAGLALLTHFQLPVWRDSETLFRATLELQPRSAFIQTSLGLLLLKEGRAAEAVEPLMRAAPSYPYGQSILGLALIETGALDAGAKALEESLRRSPQDPGIRQNVELGKARLAQLRAGSP
jgi:predicted Zn-dependent protease